MVRSVRFKAPDALGNVMVEPATATSAPSGRTVADQGTINMIYAKAVSFSSFSTAEVGGWEMTAQSISISSGLVFLPRARNVRNHRCWKF